MWNYKLKDVFLLSIKVNDKRNIILVSENVGKIDKQDNQQAFYSTTLVKDNTFNQLELTDLYTQKKTDELISYRKKLFLS